MRSSSFLFSLLVVSIGSAQSFNIDLGTPGTNPNFAYPAAGWHGTWNELQIPADFVRVPLQGLNGETTNAKFYQFGLSTMLNHNNPLTSGEDEKLMDDMALSTNSPVDGCVWIEGLESGNYEVFIYALTPNNAALQSRTRVDFATPGPIMVGGSWPVQGHVFGTTYSRFSVSVSDGKIGLHSGLYNGFIQSGINGIQIVKIGGAPIRVFADRAIPVSGQPFGGGLSSVHLSDEDKMYFLFDESGPNGEVHFFSRVPTSSPASLRFELESSATRTDLSQFSEMYNWQTGAFQTVSFGSTTLADSQWIGTPSGSSSQFVDTATNVIRSRVRWVPQADLEAADGWLTAIDQATWLATP